MISWRSGPSLACGVCVWPWVVKASAPERPKAILNLDISADNDLGILAKRSGDTLRDCDIILEPEDDGKERRWRAGEPLREYENGDSRILRVQSESAEATRRSLLRT